MCDVASRHATFYTETVTFLVENCLFKVRESQFEAESIVFRDMLQFLLPTGEGDEEGGKRDDNPVHLMGIKKNEFEQLLNVLLHRTYGKCQKVPSDIGIVQWTSILKLANIWRFDDIREVALDNLKCRMSLAEQVALGAAYNLNFESWSLPAIHELVRRQEPITFEEGQRMGLDITLKLAYVRERVICQTTDGFGRRRTHSEKRDFTRILRQTF
ncbi:hypothetical protein JVU11DRAFT_140 [Chiua virens]|nr:hypothetical protein JVU11DRAFT_140 [Chiua virens]